MSKWRTDPNDPVEPLDPQYTQWDKGEYEVNGIYQFIKTDDGGLPFFEPSPLGNLQASVRLRLVKPERQTTADGTEVEDYKGPPMSMDVPTFVVFCDKLGANIDKLHPIEPTSGFLLRVQQLLEGNASTRRKLIVYVNDRGWGTRFTGTFAPPIGEYTMRVADIYPVDGKEPLDFKDFFGNQAMKVAFEIVGNRYGHDTPFRGFTISEPFYQPFQPFQAGDVEPELTELEGGDLDTNARRFLRLITYFAPQAPDGGQWEEYAWETNPAASKFGVNEAQYPMVPVKAMVLEADRAVKGELSTTRQGRPKVDLYSFVATDQADVDASGGVPEGVPEVDVDADKGSQPEEVFHLVTLIETLARTVSPRVEQGVFHDTPKGARDINLTLTEEGKAWCRKVIVPLWDELGLPPERQFALLTGDQAEALRAALDAKHGGSGF